MFSYCVMRRLVYLLVLLAFAIVSSVAFAYDRTVYGSFRPDALNPSNNKFTMWGGSARRRGVLRLYCYMARLRQYGDYTIPSSHVG